MRTISTIQTVSANSVLVQPQAENYKPLTTEVNIANFWLLFYLHFPQNSKSYHKKQTRNPAVAEKTGEGGGDSLFEYIFNLLSVNINYPCSSQYIKIIPLWL